MPNLPLKLILPRSQKSLKLCVAVVDVFFPFLNPYLLPFSFPFSLLLFYMGQSSESLPSFSNFAKISSPFFQRVLCSLTVSSEGSKGQEDEPPTMAKAVTQIQEKALSRETGICSLLFPFFLFFPFPIPFPASCPYPFYRRLYRHQGIQARDY